MKLYFDVNSELESRYEQMSILFLNELDITKKKCHAKFKTRETAFTFYEFFYVEKSMSRIFFKHFQEDFL